MSRPVPSERHLASNARQRGSRLQRLTIRKKVFFATLTTIAVLLLLEGVLALSGVQPYLVEHDPFIGFSEQIPLFVPQEHAVTPSQMTTAANRLEYFNPQQFQHPKPSGTFRIFCLGGSTTYGRPYDDQTSFAGWLRELLPRVDSERRWEVINAGGISYASYRVAALMRELVNYQPDLFIIYTGHNEFLEDRTYRDVRQRSPAVRQLTRLLAETRTYSALNVLLHQGAAEVPHDGESLAAEVDAVLDHTVGPTSYERDDRRRARVLQHFEFNLRRMVRIARTSSAGVILVVPASNLKDCAPFKSRHTADLDAAALDRWEQWSATAEEHHSAGQSKAALESYQRAAEIDDRHAELHFRIGQLRLELGDSAAAHQSFRRAVEEDVCPLRAPAAVTAAVRDVAIDFQVPVVDFEQALGIRCQRAFGRPSPGREYFLDHVHPTIAVHGQLAAELVRSMIDEGWIASGTELRDADIAAAAQQIDSRVDRRAHAVALRNLAKVLNWAGKHNEAGALAMRALEAIDDDPESLVLAAAYLKQVGRVEQAIGNYRRAIRARPNYAEAHQLLAAALVERGQLDEAFGHFERVTQNRPDDAHAWQMLGAIRAEREQHEAAVRYFHRAAEIDPRDANIQYNLGHSLSRLGRSEQAVEHYRRSVQLDPDDADAHNNLGVLLMDARQATAAASHFREVLRIRPDDEVARRNLASALDAEQ